MAWSLTIDRLTRGAGCTMEVRSEGCAVRSDEHITRG